MGKGNGGKRGFCRCCLVLVMVMMLLLLILKQLLLLGSVAAEQALPSYESLL